MKIELTFDELRAARPELEIKIVQRLGYDPATGRALVCDGVAGAATKRAVYLNPDAVVGPVALVALAELLKGAGELLGNNDGPDVWRYNRSRGPYRAPFVLWAWCALFASWCLWQVHQSFERVTGAVRLVRDHLTRVQQHEVAPDDLAAWWSATRPRPYGHVGIVAVVTPQVVWTIEGNVDLVGRIDGVAARRLARPALTRADGAPLAYLGRYIPKVTPKALASAVLQPDHHDLDEPSEDDDHVV